MLHSHNERRRNSPAAKIGYKKKPGRGRRSSVLKAAKIAATEISAAEVSTTVVSVIVIECFAQQQSTSETTKQWKAHTHPATWSSAVGSVPTTIRSTHDSRTMAVLGLIGVELLASHNHLLDTLSLRFRTNAILCEKSDSDRS